MIDLKIESNYSHVIISLIEGRYYITDDARDYNSKTELFVEDCKVSPDGQGGFKLSGKARHFQMVYVERNEREFGTFFEQVHSFLEKNPDFIDPSYVVKKEVDIKRKWWRFWDPKVLETKEYNYFSYRGTLLKKRKDIVIHFGPQGGIIAYSGFYPSGFTAWHHKFFPDEEYDHLI